MATGSEVLTLGDGSGRGSRPYYSVDFHAGLKFSLEPSWVNELLVCTDFSKTCLFKSFLCFSIKLLKTFSVDYKEYFKC